MINIDVEKLTPMMKHYIAVKEQHPDCIVFYRLGDFYEMFFDDARVVSQELELTLTGRACGLPERAPMCGVPYHAAETYISRLTSRGFKVAICEQVEDPKDAQGMVKRDVVRIVTPGTTMDDAVLSRRISNYTSMVYVLGHEVGIASADVSTGELIATVFSDDPCFSALMGELKRLAPIEILLSPEAAAVPSIISFIKNSLSSSITLLEPYEVERRRTQVLLFTHFLDTSDKLDKNYMTTTAIGALMQYLIDTQKSPLYHIADGTLYQAAQFLELDETAIRNLELLENLTEKKKHGSLLWVLDRTRTNGGSRAIKKWLTRPLLNPVAIARRQSAVAALTEAPIVLDDIRENLSQIRDIERLMTKFVLGNGNARDLISLKASFAVIPAIKAAISDSPSAYLGELNTQMDGLEALHDRIQATIDDEVPISVKEGGIIRDGYDAHVDRFRYIQKNSGELLAQIEGRERARTGIKNLRVTYNKVFGYFIEVTNSYLDKVPADYIRKQTLTGCERFITEELKKVEDEVYTATEKLAMYEYKLFLQLVDELLEKLVDIQRTALAIDALDALCSLAIVALKNNYVRPTVNDSTMISITDGRHPVVEKFLEGSLFVANNANLDTDENRMAIITGPNMAGKSTYMRQIALLTIMAQMGSFVPAKSASFGIVDRIFTRVGASDDLVGGKSTFAVEMTEVARILNNATGKSLILLDEIGRGTSTFDGLSIAWAVVEYCSQKIKAKTLFATHYHELTELEEKIAGVHNFSIAVKTRGDDITFLRKIIPGGTDRSYGIEVAKLSGVCESVIRRAKEILSEIENGGTVSVKTKSASKASQMQEPQMSLMSFAGSEVLEELKKLDVTTLSPIEAMNILYQLQQKAKNE